MQILVELYLSASESIPGGGLIVWQVSLGDNGSVEIDLVTEPWNEDPTSEWVIPDYVRESFKDMGGSIEDAIPTAVTSNAVEAGKELTGWESCGDSPTGKL